MNRTRIWIVPAISCVMLATVALFAQNPPPAETASLDLTGLPTGRGVFYHRGGQWVALTPNVLMPFWEGRELALDILNVGSDHTVTEIPGSHSGVQIGNDPRPTFYLHGISPSSVRLVRAVSKEDYRELRMPVSRHFRKWAHFRSEDVTDFAITGINGDVVAIKPAADLKPGEYAIATSFAPDEYWVRLGFDFGVLGQVGR
jgi:hypothetical protein